MKKVLTLALALILILSLSACGKQETGADNSQVNSQTTSGTSNGAADGSADVTTSKPEGTVGEGGSSIGQNADSQTPGATTSNSGATQNKPNATQSAPTDVGGNVGVTASQSAPPSPNQNEKGNKNPLKELKIGEEYVTNVYSVYDDENIYALGFQFYDDGGYGDGDHYCILLDAMFTNKPEDDYVKERTPVMYKGKPYYRCGAGQSPAFAELTEKDITITKDGSVIKLIMNAKGNLQVTTSSDSKYPVGMEFSISWNMLK